MEKIKEQLKNRIAESSQVMVTTEFPHLYYKAVETRKLEQIIDEVFEGKKNEQTTEEKEI